MENLTFRYELTDFKATQLVSKDRFVEKLKIKGLIDDIKFKTKKLLIGGGNIEWKNFVYEGEYHINNSRMMEDKALEFNFILRKNHSYGRVFIDLWTLATGPVEHNLPIYNVDKQIVGRFSFKAIFEQIGNVSVIFKEVKIKRLPTVNGECNPYLKYYNNPHWSSVEGTMKTNYSSNREKTTEPSWNYLPLIKFQVTLKELIHESILIHINHKGRFSNTPLAKCNLLFKTLVENGKIFKDEDLISFKGNLKVGNATIEGLLVFKNLPKFAQMKNNGIRTSLHTENGISDGEPLLQGMPLPKKPIIQNEEFKEGLKTKTATLISGYKEEKNHTDSLILPDKTEPKMEKLISFSPSLPKRVFSSNTNLFSSSNTEKVTLNNPFI